MDTITVIDFGGQYTQLIARRIRENSVYSRIVPPSTPLDDVKDSNGIILSGGPKSVINDAVPYNPDLLNTGKPTLGICYGYQLLVHANGGRVEKGSKAEYGKTPVTLTESPLFDGLNGKINAWMSHWDTVTSLPEGYLPIATSNGHPAAFQNGNLYGVQFHPEVTHTERGTDILRNFINITGCKGDWSLDDYIAQTTDTLNQTIDGRDVIAFVSGGVDSTVAATLVANAKKNGGNIGDVYLVHIDSGLMRAGESDAVVEHLNNLGIGNVIYENATNQFITALKGVSDPEQKRKIIGDQFITIMNTVSERLQLREDTLLCQGTLYTDLIESGKGVGKHAAVIKSHHNVNTPFVLEKREQGLIVEPNSEIFKDEVRKVGELLGLPEELVWRQPFPGPGLAIRIIGGDVNRERLDMLRKADRIFTDAVEEAGLHQGENKIWQYFAALLCAKSVGVMGDERKHGYTCALRAVTSHDGMTADWYPFGADFLGRVSNKIVNEVEGITRVLYDTTSKPPGTIEFE